MTTDMMILDPDHPAYSDQPYERDPSRECEHGVAYTQRCADCLDLVEAHARECADGVAEDREAEGEWMDGPQWNARQWVGVVEAYRRARGKTEGETDHE
jgi:hypothetical protein